jgi:hypothetical protein
LGAASEGIAFRDAASSRDHAKPLIFRGSDRWFPATPSPGALVFSRMRLLDRGLEIDCHGWQAVIQRRSASHWKDGRSAALLARSWSQAAGLPPAVADALSPLFGPDFRLDEGLVEHETKPPGRGAGSATDLLAIGDVLGSKIVLAVEGKVDEGFDHRIGCWVGLGKSSKSRVNRTLRWTSMAKDLGICAPGIDAIPYQLLHRTWAALTEATRRGATHAVLVVHSFDDHRSGWDDFVSFARRFRPELAAQPGVPVCVSTGSPLLWLVWVADTGGVAGPERRCSTCGV